MHKKILVLLTGAIALSISAVPVLASDPPTDDGQYIWQDENGDYWYRNGSEDEYIGEGNYAPDPDSGELMEGNDAGWTEQDGYFEPHYYYEDGSVWLEDATGTTYIGSRDKYYIDDYGNLQEYSDSETDSSSGDSSEESSDTSFLRAKCPCNDVLIRMIPCFRFADLAHSHHFLYQGMISGDLADPVLDHI